MRAVVVFAAMLLAATVAGCPVTQPQNTPVEAKHLKEQTTGCDYWLYVPSYYSDQRDWPVVVTLHGSNIWDGPIRQVMEWKYLAERHGFLLVAPHVVSAEGILPVIQRIKKLRKDEIAVLAILDELASKYRIDRREILLTGFSAGGYPLYWIGLRNPQRFSMLIARACNSSIEQFEQIELTDDARKMPIVIFWGKDDLLPIQKQSWAAFRWLREHRCFGTRMHETKGGHLRRPELAYRFWLEKMSPEQRAQMR